MTENFVDFINSLQIGLTVTFVGLVSVLLTVWGPQLIAALKTRPWTPEAWLAVGIGFGFFFNAVDWSYWAITWLTVLFELPQEESLMRYGPTSNLIFRQVPSIYAIFCHLVAAQMMHEQAGKDETGIVRYSLLGLVSALAIYAVARLVK